MKKWTASANQLVFDSDLQSRSRCIWFAVEKFIAKVR